MECVLRISALIPTYNRRAFTCRAIESVFAQTLPVDEVIVVDDGSTDGTADEIFGRYGSRVKLLRQKNAGVSAARNSAIRIARGEWLAFLDSDDVWSPRKLELQFDAISALGANEFGACFTDCIFEGNAEMKLSAFKEAGLESRSIFGTLEDPARYVLARHPVIFVQNLVVRRSLIEELGGFDEDMVISEDTDILFRLALRTKVCFVAETLVRIDRTPCREVGLCELYGSKDDRVYDSLERMYSKWLALPPQSTIPYWPMIRELLLSTRYEYAIAKATRFRLVGALRKLHSARALENGYGAVMATLLSRIVRKMQRVAGNAPA
jgi:glycosyltransferase involved in cell wall biosynthesis